MNKYFRQSLEALFIHINFLCKRLANTANRMHLKSPNHCLLSHKWWEYISRRWLRFFLVPGNSVVCFESIYKWISWVLIGKVASRPGCAMIFYTKPVCLQKVHRTFFLFFFFFCIRRLSKRLSVCVFLLVYRDNLKAFDDIFFSRCRDKPCQLHLFYHSWHCDI